MKNLKQKFKLFMISRYKNDRLNMHLSIIVIVLATINFFFSNRILYYITLAIFLVTLFRYFSKNYNKRRRENYLYGQWLSKIKKSFNKLKNIGKYKYLKCPNCKKETRVPRKRGEIVVTCPSCKHKFDAKS